MVCANFLYINICISCYFRVKNNPLEPVGACTQYHTPLHHDGYAVACACNKKNGQQKLSVKVAGGGLEAEARGDTFWRRLYVEQ